VKIGIICFSASGCGLSCRIADVLRDHDCSIYSKTTAQVTGTTEIKGSAGKWTETAFREYDAIIYIGAVGIAVRYIAPFIKNKATDPAVVVLDERGTFAISLLSGHIGGCNDLTKQIAEGIGAIPVITTATDINGKLSIDSYAVKHNMHIGNMSAAKDVSARIVDGKTVAVSSEVRIDGGLPPELVASDSGDLGIYISYGTSEGPFRKNLKLIPRCHILGIGCRKGVSKDNIESIVKKVLADNDISMRSVRSVASIDLKNNEKGLLEFSEGHGIVPLFFSAEHLSSLPDKGYTASERVLAVTGVDNVCERAAVAASTGGEIVIKKTCSDGVTVAVVREPFCLSFGDE
jgi:cobalt-precorrin 5A hydrolase